MLGCLQCQNKRFLNVNGPSWERKNQWTSEAWLAFVLMSQCGNNNELALQHGGFVLCDRLLCHLKFAKCNHISNVVWVLEPIFFFLHGPALNSFCSFFFSICFWNVKVQSNNKPFLPMLPFFSMPMFYPFLKFSHHLKITYFFESFFFFAQNKF